MKVTVVIPAHNESAALRACLDALIVQETRYKVRVIVVNNASTDSTKSVAPSYADRLDIMVIDEPCLGRGRARACGFAEAKTDVVLSTDADSIVPPNWVEFLVSKLLQNPQVSAVSGSSYIADGTKFTNLTMRIGMPLSLRVYRMLVGHYMLTGANFAIRRRAYEEAGGFDPRQDMLDDVDLSFRVNKVGRIMYLKEPRVLTEGDIFSKGYIRGFWHYARHLPSLLKRYGPFGGWSFGKSRVPPIPQSGSSSKV